MQSEEQEEEHEELKQQETSKANTPVMTGSMNVQAHNSKFSDNQMAEIMKFIEMQ
jgi:hypothetical protein